MLEFCKVVGAREPVRLPTEVLGEAAMLNGAVGAAVLVRLETRGLGDSVEVDHRMVKAGADCLALLIAENGYGPSGKVRLASQQFVLT